MVFTYSWAVESNLENDFSFERFQRYVEWALGDKEKAFELYALNTSLSESLYTPLHILEVSLRNRIHIVLKNEIAENWYDHLSLDGKLAIKLEKAKQDIAVDQKDCTPDRIVSSLTFGFWTGLLSPHYEDLWRMKLYTIATKDDGSSLQRKQLMKNLMPIRVLRNRIAHHEPILYWDVAKHYEKILMVTQWLSPDAAIWSRHHSRFESVLAARPAFMDTLSLK